MKAITESGQQSGLHVTVYPGDNKILIAMSLDDAMLDEQSKNFAGFAIWRQVAGQAETPLANRISFTSGVSNVTTAATQEWINSDQAPFQKFRWIDVPPDGFTASITYRVKALYFKGQGTDLKDGPQASVRVAPAAPAHTKFRPAFTRGYIASQAYADKFHNAAIRPDGPKTPSFDTAPFKPQYEWLGADARVALFDFISDCENDNQANVDVFAYDLDEPDVIAAICRLGKAGRLRAILDNAPLHSKVDPKSKDGPPPEIKAAQMIIAAAGAAKVKQGHFARFQHNKVFIKRDANGAAQRVIFGSMNFSVRGLYVQANHVIVVDDPATAAMFAKAFDVAFAGDVKAAPFQQTSISQGYMTGSAADSPTLPKFSLALSPHKDASVSLGPMTDRIQKSTSSVLFAVMSPTGGGPVLGSLRTIAAKPTVFSYGTVETDKGLAVQSPNGAMGDLTGFAALTKNVPAPFKKETDGGPGMHIHDKFVVVDFNATNPAVFAGSSNLAAGGETDNGDSLAMIEDESIATMYAIEAIALFDHFHFRKAMQKTTAPLPLTLWFPGKPNAPTPWWKEYYDPSKIQLRDRCLFANVPLPTGVATTKTVDWSAVDADAGSAKKSPGKTKTAPAKKAPAKSKTAGVKGAPAKTKTAPAKRAPAKSKAAPAKKAPAKSKAAPKRAAGKSKMASAKKAPRKSKAAPAKKAPAKTGKPAASARSTRRRGAKTR
jgi:phosphatidylserine/phosphatidylglycerophosphate/cardiolipin synthase-like enzyme